MRSKEWWKEQRERELEKNLENTGETVIVDGQGYYHDGMYCTGVYGACPYWVEDIDGVRACYQDMYRQCEHK